jgi:hypothetical protein
MWILWLLGVSWTVVGLIGVVRPGVFGGSYRLGDYDGWRSRQPGDAKDQRRRIGRYRQPVWVIRMVAFMVLVFGLAMLGAMANAS